MKGEHAIVFCHGVWRTGQRPWSTGPEPRRNPNPKPPVTSLADGERTVASLSYGELDGQSRSGATADQGREA